MVSDGDSLPRSLSQPDQSESSTAKLSNDCSQNQSSCSSLTSGLGQSDQNSCHDSKSRSINTDQDNLCHLRKDSIDICDEQTTVHPSDDICGARASQAESQKHGTVSTVKSKKDDCVRPGHSEKSNKNIKRFVDIIFTDSQSITLEEKAEFGKLMRTSEARLAFAMYVDDYRVNSKRVSELTFYSLAQYFSIVLLECLLAEDFRPAKIIMNMMFTYYYEQNYDNLPLVDRPTLTKAQLQQQQSDSQTIRVYLYTLLKDQEIFKSIRFWTSAFYESVIIERNNHSVFVDRGPGKLSNERRNEELDCGKNITFGLLGSFIHNMCLLDLSNEFCQEFLDKHSTIAGLSDDQLDMLRSNLKSMFESETDSQVTTSERLTAFLQKLSTRLNQQSSG